MVLASSNGITFVSGDLVVGLVGNTDGSAPGDNQASPIELEQLTTSGVVSGTMLLPQTTTTTGGVTEHAISGEYGSSSEGSLQLAANGQSLVIAGYGVNAAAFNSGGTATYGTTALAQTFTVANGGTNGAPAGVTLVPRVVADINANGTVDTSTALLNVYNENNPRSVATTDGTSFYLGGQGVKGDTTQGVFLAQDGAGSATSIHATVDARTVELANGSLYVSQDSKQGTGGTSNISSFAAAQPTGTSAETPLPGISQTVTLSAANGGNGINGSAGTVHISPENYFFANSTTLYVADGGNPKQGGAGDGGLQKYSLVNGNWNLDYTLSAGLNLVADTTADPGQGGKATTGLIGLTGQVNAATGTVSLYATNATIGDLNQTSVYGINDTLAATSASAASAESFSTLFTAPTGTNVRGIAFAPTAAVCFASGTPIRTNRGDVPVEELAVGDFVVTSSGERRPIRWLGHRTVDCRSHPDRKAVLPVCIAADAFAPGKPTRDILVSPGHAICVDVLGEVLMPAMALVNGSTVAPVEVDAVTYWHVELDSHDVLVAAGLPAESYLEMGNRDFFAEQPVVMLGATPDAEVATHDDFCRPFHADGPIVMGVRAQLAVRARALGWTLEDGDPMADLHLIADGRRIEPVRRGLVARFAVPAGVGELRLASTAARPSELGLSADPRLLGVDVEALVVADGFGAPRAIALDDPRLDGGFYAVETPADSPAHRWTDGNTRLPAELLEGCQDGAFLAVTVTHLALPRWKAKSAATADGVAEG